MSIKVTCLTLAALLFPLLLWGQAVPKELLELWRLDREMYTYLGDGKFISLRSSRQRWFETEFDSVGISRNDSTVFLRGRAYNRNISYPSLVPDAVLLVGRFTEYPGDDSTVPHASLQVFQRFSADSTGQFQITCKVSPQDYLCVVQSNDSMMGDASAGIYTLGGYFSELPRPSRGDGPYVLIQPDSSLTVLQMCGDSLTTRELPATDGQQFRGLCVDSAGTYSVRNELSVGADSVTNVQRIFAISDIHGEYRNLFKLLVNAYVIDKDGHWNWRSGHLVVDGDIFDRGDQVTECLWFLYRLESEARELGGDVHVLLGNHELMVLRGDYRYVNEKYRKQIEAQSGMSLKELYGPESILGQWLRSRSSVIKLDSIIFVHGGLAPSIVTQGRSIAEMNRDIRKAIDMTSEQLAADTATKALLGSLGPLWYRGYHESMEGKYDMATAQQVDSILSYFGVTEIVVGHTEGNEVRELIGGRVIALDVPTDELGSLQGLLWEDGMFTRITGCGRWEWLEKTAVDSVSH